MTTTEFSNQIVGLQESLGRFAFKTTHTIFTRNKNK